MSCSHPEATLPPAPDAAGHDHNAFALMQPRAPAPTPPELKNGARVKHNNVAPQGVYRPDYNIRTPHGRTVILYTYLLRLAIGGLFILAFLLVLLYMFIMNNR